MIRSSAGLVAVSCFASLPAQAWEDTGWRTAFESPSIAEALPADARRVQVVGVGAAPEVRAAAAALVEGLRSNGLKLVIDGSALGDVSELSDAQIVTRAAVFPVDAVIVLRVSQGSEGQLDQAVAASYLLNGTPLFSLWGRRGEPASLHKRTSSDPSSLPLSSAARPASPPSAQRQYELRFLEVKDQVVDYDANGPAVIQVPVRGKSAHILQLDDFLDLVGRHDLVEKEQQQRRKNLAAALTGGALFATGMGAGLYVILSGVIQASQAQDACTTTACYTQVDQSQQIQLYTGAGIILLGAAALAVGVILATRDTSPVTIDEERHMADEYNRTLRQELGLPDEPDAEPPPASRSSSLLIEPGIPPQGRVFAVSLRF